MALVEARRFLHCCYCCTDAVATTDFFATGLDLELRMRSAGERVDGRQMGFPGEVETDACFVYDRRGPRVGPGIEVQHWIDPPTEGSPYAAPEHVGFQALGFAVPDVDATVGRLTRLGCAAVGTPGDAPGAGVTLRDPTGVLLDVVADGAADPTRLAHLRATVTDLDTSVAWYEDLGFTTVGAGGADGLGPGGRASIATLRLPDEPFALVLVQWHEPRSTGTPYASGNHAGLYRFAIAVDDTRAAHAALGARPGPTGPPQAVELPGTNVPDMWIAFLADPDGMVVELVERPRSAFAPSAGMAP